MHANEFSYSSGGTIYWNPLLRKEVKEKQYIYARRRSALILTIQEIHLGLSEKWLHTEKKGKKRPNVFVISPYCSAIL